MGGSGLGMGSMGAFGSTLGYGNVGGGSPSANTTAAVTNPGSGKLEAYDPSTMTTQTKALTMPGGPINAVGMASSGVPDYVSNFLQQGGSGTMPTSTNQAGFANTEHSVAGDLLHPTNASKVKATGAEAIKAGQIAPTTPKASTPASTPATGATGLQMVGGNTGGMQQPLFVNDQWNAQGGTSMPVATPALGPQMGGQAPVWTDGKGNFFFDAQGTKAVTGPALTQFRNQFGVMK